MHLRAKDAAKATKSELAPGCEKLGQLERWEKLVQKVFLWEWLAFGLHLVMISIASTLWTFGPWVVLLFAHWAASYVVVSLPARVTLRIMEIPDLLSRIIDVLFLRCASDSWPDAL